MTITELIAHLQHIREAEGDIEVRIQSLSHTEEPEPEVRTTTSGPRVVLLNP